MPQSRLYNFTPGPAMLPLPVMQRIREEMMDYGGLGTSVVEISHLTPEFRHILAETEALLRELLAIPPDYRVLFAHGGAQMQFASVPLNLMGLSPARRAVYLDSGFFAHRAVEEARRYGTVEVAGSSEDTLYDRIPAFEAAQVPGDAAYVHITTNNTIVGTRWQAFPALNGVPLVGDATSEILSRPMDLRQFGLVYAGFQKNLGPSGVALVIVREDLIGHALPSTPKLLDYARLAADNSLSNTANTFAIYVAWLMLHWVRDNGGVPEMERRAHERAGLIYDAVARNESFYTAHAVAEHRSIMNVTFKCPTPELDKAFLAEALEQGLYGLKGHRDLGGLRASIYNGMPLEGARALADFMDDFARRNG